MSVRRAKLGLISPIGGQEGQRLLEKDKGGKGIPGCCGDNLFSEWEMAAPR